MKFKSLSELRRPAPREILLGALPSKVRLMRSALQKAFKINELVRDTYKKSYEWYGFTIAQRDDPETIVDIGLPGNDRNIHDYTAIGPRKIAEYRESLPPHSVINGWIHSHGDLDFHQFSDVDHRNHLTVLEYVTALLRKPVSKREITTRDLVLLVKDRYAEDDLKRGNISVITDVPVSDVTIMETVYGGFSYGIVIGDSGWHRQEIHYKRRGVLTGWTEISMREAELSFVDGERSPAEWDFCELAEQVRQKIEPGARSFHGIERP